MQKLRKHIYFFRQILLVFFALFALASCSVKEPVFKAIGADYHRPLNQTKTTQNLEHSCHLSEKASLTTVKNLPADPVHLLAGTSFGLNFWTDEKAEPVILPLSSSTDSKPQPLYILYKRLKFDLA
ncbi:MAG: hypothetical protein ACK5M7_20800 [Draconibacterium sp.]